LIDHWDDLRDWLDKGRDDLRLHRRLADAANQWDASKRPDGSLWRPPDLDLLEGFQGRASGDMTPVEMSFYRASKDAELAEQQKQDSQRSRARTAAIAMGFLAIAAVIAGGVAYLQSVEADSQRLAAERNETMARAAATDAAEAANSAAVNESRALTAVASIMAREGQYLKAVQFALAAWPRSRDDNRPMLKATLNVLGEAQRNQRQIFPPMRHEGPVWSAEFSEDETKILTSSFDHTARLFDATTGEEVIKLIGHDGAVRGAVFSEDGSKILTRSEDGTARLYDATTGEEIIPAMRHERWVISAVFSEDEAKILTSSLGGTVRLFDTKTGRELINPIRHEGSVESVIFSQDGSKILTSSDDGGARLYDATTGTEFFKPMRHKAWVNSAVFSKDETKILTSSDDNTARLFDATTGEEVIRFMGHEGGGQGRGILRGWKQDPDSI